MGFSISRGTNLLQTILKNKLKNGDIVIDGTMGNGYDTLFLAEIVGREGKVYAFDIQATSIEATSKRLEKNGINPQEGIQLIQDGHENIDQYVEEEVDAAMFNLGYLPGGDHEIITRPSTTINALHTVIKKLKKGGIISIMIYYGHEGGTLEKDAVLSLCENLSSDEFVVIKTEYINGRNNPPITVFIEKK